MATSSHPATLAPPFHEERPDGCHDGEAVSLERYLDTMYHPDCDYIDGHLEERNVGEFDHNRIQKRLLVLFTLKETEWNVECIQEQRLQISASNFRIPDFMVLPGLHHPEQIVRETPLLIVEVLSPKDTFKRLHEKVLDYIKIGVPSIWTFDPFSRKAYICNADGFDRVYEEELAVLNTEIRLRLKDVFSILDAE